MKTHDTISALAPTPEAFEPEWSQATVAGILAEAPAAQPTRPWWRKTRARGVAVVAAGAIALTTGAAFALGGPEQVVKDTLLDFSRQPNTSGNGLGVLDDPAVVAQFQSENGLFTVWIAESSSGKVCYAMSDGAWNGEGTPTKDQLEYGCGGDVWDHELGRTVWLSRPEQLGGFFKDSGPLLYGVSPYPEAVEVRVQGAGVNRTLPVRPDSHGYGAALPEAAAAAAVTVTFLDDAGRTLGTKRWVAPAG